MALARKDGTSSRTHWQKFHLHLILQAKENILEDESSLFVQVSDESENRFLTVPLTNSCNKNARCVAGYAPHNCAA